MNIQESYPKRKTESLISFLFVSEFPFGLKCLLWETEIPISLSVLHIGIRNKVAIYIKYVPLNPILSVLKADCSDPQMKSEINVLTELCLMFMVTH